MRCIRARESDFAAKINSGNLVKMLRKKYASCFMLIYLSFFGESESFNVNNRISQSSYNNLLLRIKRELESDSPTTNRRTKLYGEITEDGVLYKGGFDLPIEFQGSGTADFAFNGPSFRRWKPTENKIENAYDVTSEVPGWYSPDEWKKMKEQLAFNQKLLDAVTTESNILPEVSSEKNTEDYPLGYISPCQFNCHKMTATSEYNPVCGSNGVTYSNTAKFVCAQKCGKKITGRYHITCGFGAPVI